ncbi:hypothetical protein ABK040_011609 [Willaertia magna]
MSKLQLSIAQKQNLQQFVQYVKLNPEVLHDEDLQFFKDFLINDCGATKLITPKAQVIKEEDMSDKYLDVLGSEFSLIKERNPKKVNELTDKGNKAFKEKNFKDAAIFYGKAIELSDGESAILFIKRAECLLQLNKPLSVRRDCDIAIRLNPEAGKAYRLRGKAYISLGKYKEAKESLEISRRLEDDTTESDKLLEEVKGKLNNNNSSTNTSTTAIPNTNEMKNNNNINPQLMKLVSQDKELMNAILNNERISIAINEIASNPNAALKYNNDKEVMTMFMKFMKILGSTNK